MWATRLTLAMVPTLRRGNLSSDAPRRNTAGAAEQAFLIAAPFILNVETSFLTGAQIILTVETSFLTSAQTFLTVPRSLLTGTNSLMNIPQPVGRVRAGCP